MAIELKITGLDREVQRFEAMARRAEDMAPALQRWGLEHVRKTRRVLDSGDRGIRTLHRQSGLGASLTFHVQGNEWAEGSNKAYAASQQFGPRGGFYESSRPGGFLAIPIADNLGARDPRYARPRDVPGGIIIRTGEGADEELLVVSERARKRREPQEKRTRMKAPRLKNLALRLTHDVWFLLLKRVRGRGHAYASFDAEDQRRWQEIGARWIRDGK